MVNVAVAEVTDVTGAVPWLTPSSVKLTVPVGPVDPVVEAVIVAET